MTRKRALRVDAERNRQRVLEVAHTVFAAEGLGVPIDEIARRAGLGIGTLYRHFPTKESLLQAVLVGRLEELVADADARSEAADADGAFFGFLERLVEDKGVPKKDLLDALAGADFDFQRKVKAIKGELRRAVSVLLERAQKAGSVRRDVEVGEVFALLMGTFSGLDRQKTTAQSRARLFAIVSDGLRGRR
jgi:AcrR family transcriptional regulator